MIVDPNPKDDEADLSYIRENSNNNIGDKNNARARASRVMRAMRIEATWKRRRKKEGCIGRRKDSSG